MPDESDSLDLTKLSFRPDWVDSLESKSSTAGGEVVWGRADGRAISHDDRGGDRGPRRDGGRFDRRGGPPPPGSRGPRPPQGDQRGGGGGFRGPPRPPGQGFGPGQGQGQGQGPRRPSFDRPAGPRPPQGDRRGPPGPRSNEGDRRGPRPPQGDRRDFGPRRDSGDRRERFERFDDRPPPPAPLGGWNARLIPEPRALEAMARQIRGSSRAYPIFEVAKLFLGGRERFLVKLSPRPHGSKAPPPPPPPRAYGNRPPPPPPQEVPGPPELVRCRADGSLWLTREEAIRHILYSPAIESYYRSETVTVEAPKGNFTAIAVCGMSGTLLGPPNHHAYQHNIARLHHERFADMPLDRYKSRIRIEKDEAILLKWQEQISTETNWVTVDPGEGGEPLRFRTGAEMEAHFLRNLSATALETVKHATISGTLQARYMSPPIAALVRIEVDRQQRFPMQLVQDLCRDLERQGLRFFKRDRKTTFVCRARPHFLADDVVLSDRIRAIVELVRANPGIDYARLVAVLAPQTKVEPAAKPKAKAEEPPAEPAAPASDGGLNAPAGPFTLWTLPFVAAAAPAAPAAEEKPAPAAHLSPEEIAILQDLRWLMGEGYVTEFNTGALFILGRPAQVNPRRQHDHYGDAEMTTAAEIAAEAEHADAAGEPAGAASEQPETANQQAEGASEQAGSSVEPAEAPAGQTEEPPPADETPAETPSALGEPSSAPAEEAAPVSVSEDEAAPAAPPAEEAAPEPVAAAREAQFPSGPFSLWTLPSAN